MFGFENKKVAEQQPPPTPYLSLEVIKDVWKNAAMRDQLCAAKAACKHAGVYYIHPACPNCKHQHTHHITRNEALDWCDDHLDQAVAWLLLNRASKSTRI